MKEKGFVIKVTLVLAVCWVIYFIAVHAVSRTFVLDVGGIITLLIFLGFGMFLIYITLSFVIICFEER